MRTKARWAPPLSGVTLSGVTLISAALTGAALTGMVRATQAFAAEPEPPPAIAMSAAECEVWTRERSFAQSVADHDATAFAEHLHPGAVFIGGPQPLRGAKAVAEGWAPLVKGDKLRLRWHPEQVVIGGDPDIALSMGPYWMEDPRPGADPRYRSGRFISTWKRDASGTWHVLFDGGGGGEAKPASEAEIAALKAALPATCPHT